MTYPLIITLSYPAFSVNFQPNFIYSDLSRNPAKKPYRLRLKIKKTGTTFLSYRLKPLSLLHQHFLHLIVVRQDDGKVVVFSHAEQVASALVVGI